MGLEKHFQETGLQVEVIVLEETEWSGEYLVRSSEDSEAIHNLCKDYWGSELVEFKKAELRDSDPVPCYAISVDVEMDNITP
jgi:glutathione peroxidase-family protein